MESIRSGSCGCVSRRGFTLVELLVSVAIIGILAAIAIPVFRGYVNESRMGEAAANLQGILEAEEAYFTRFRQYTGDLTICPSAQAAAGRNQPWPQNLAADCDQGWVLLGWYPDDPVYFQYEVFSLYDNQGQRVQLPTALAAGGWGVDWNTEFTMNLNTIQPWCAVQATADTDGDNKDVVFRTNSFNQKVFRNSRDLY